MAELVDALVSGTSVHYERAGSSPVLGTLQKQRCPGGEIGRHATLRG